MGLYILLWSLSGIALFIWAWTANRDLTTEEIAFVLIAGFMGPFVLLPVLLMSNKIVLLKCRKDKNK